MPDPLALYEVDEKVGIVTLNRPGKLNAISAELREQLTGAFARADADPQTSVVLLRAEGRSFCAGYDIAAKEPVKDDWRSDPASAHEHLRVQLDFEMVPWLMKKPVIASVQGHVIGGGCELVMLCDLTIAADNATKRAVNRGADAAGFRTALYAGLDVVGPLYATKTEFGTKFRDIVATEGGPAAVKWRAAQFRE